MRVADQPWHVQVDHRVLRSIMAKTGRVHECELEEPEVVAFNEDHARTVFHYRSVTYCLTYAVAPRGTFVLEVRGERSTVYDSNGDVLRSELRTERPGGADPILEALRRGPGPGPPELN
jgi:hypothetical protein